jgi:hypothetical protein
MEIEMKDLIGFKNLVIVTAIFIFCSTQRAHAYIDPGTGSYIIQIIIGGLLGVMFALKVYWKKLKAYFSNLLSNRTQDDSNEN